MAAPDPAPALDGLLIEAVDWLPSGGRSGLLRVRGRWTAGAPGSSLPELRVDLDGVVHPHASLPDPHAGRDAGAWRGAYVVRSALLVPQARLSLAWPDGRRAHLPAPEAHDVASRRLGAAPARAPEPRGGEVVDRAVLAERRARRAKAAEQAQARIAREALRAVEVLEQRAAELEERLAAAPGGEAAALRARAEDLSAEAQRLRGAPALAGERVRGLEEALAVALAAMAALDSQLREARAGLHDAALGRLADGLRLAALATLRSAERAALERSKSDAAAAEARTAELAARAAESDRGRALAEAAAQTAAAERRAAELAWASLADELAELRSARVEAAFAAPEPAAAPPGGSAPPMAPVPANLGELARRLAASAAGAPAPAAAQVVADLDAAAQALRSRAAGPPPAALRDALVSFAAEDGSAAAELLAGLLPAQAAVVARPLEWDLTITGLGTFACTVSDGTATVRPVERPRRRAAVRLRGDAVTLTGLLAGRGPRIRRFKGPARVSGRRRRLEDLAPLAAGGPSLADAVRAGARLDPVLALRCLPHAVPAEWTAGHRFTVALSFVGHEHAERVVHIVACDGEGLSASTDAPDGEPDARVSMPEPAFRALLLGETPAPADRPVVRGDHRAVGCLRAWADRVRTGV